jgi:hypothetical protein
MVNVFRRTEEADRTKPIRPTQGIKLPDRQTVGIQEMVLILGQPTRSLLSRELIWWMFLLMTTAPAHTF